MSSDVAAGIGGGGAAVLATATVLDLVPLPRPPLLLAPGSLASQRSSAPQAEATRSLR